MKKYKDIVLLFLLSLIPLLWYGIESNKMINSVDVGYPLNPIEFIKNRVFAWNGAWNLGSSQKDVNGSILYHGLEVILTLLTNSVFNGQKVFVVFWFFIIMLSMYWLIKKIPVFAQKPYMAVIASILFCFNHFQLHGWRALWISRFSTYMQLPLIFLLLIDYYEEKISLIKTSILISLVIFFLNGGGSPPLFGTTFLLAFGVFLFYLCKNIPRGTFTVFKKTGTLVLFTVFFSFVFSLFWSLPYLRFILSSYSSTLSAGGGPGLMLSWTDQVSTNTSILNLLRLQGVSFWGTGSLPSDYQSIYTSTIFIVLSFILPVLIFLALFLAKKPAEKKYLALLSFLAVVGLIFSAGSHEPFRDFYIFLLNAIPGFPIFRSPIYKFGGLLWFSCAVLIAFTLSTILEKIRIKIDASKLSIRKSQYIFPALFITFILAYNFPFFNSNFLNWRLPLTMMEKIPNYVLDFGKWADSNKDESRILMLPALSSNWRTEELNWGYWSAAPVTYLLTNKNVLTNDGGLLGNETSLIDTLYKAIEKNNNSWFNLATLLGIKDLLLKKDFFYNLDWIPANAPFIYEKILSANDKIKKVKTFGEWEVYQIANDPYKKIYLPDDVISYLSADEDIPLAVSLNSKAISQGEKLVFIPQENENIFDSLQKTIVIPGPVKFSLPVEKGKLVVPKPKFMPGSPLYFLTENKEKELVQNTKDEKQLVDVYLGLSLKRLGELKEMIDANANFQDISPILDRYSVLWGEINKTYQSLRANKNQSTNTLVPRLRSYIWEERNFFAELINNQKDETINNSLKNYYKNLGDLFRTIRAEDEKEIPLSEYEQAYYNSNIVLLTPGYKWSVPQAGKYGIFLSNSSVLANSSEVQIDVDGITVNSKQITENSVMEGWQKVGDIDLEKGAHGLKITADGIPVYSFKRGDLVFYKGLKTEDVRLTTDGDIKNQNTDIKYTKTNPTRYKVEVNSSGQPFTLVFNERFDPDWKVYMIDKRLKTYDLSKNSHGGIISDILSLKSYIINLLDEHIFNTLFLKPLSEQNHFMANGFANGWKINSKQQTDNRQQKYELIIEYWPQRLLWLGYSVSIVSVLSAVAYLVITRKKE